MINFNFSKCPKCGRTTQVMVSNNPLSGTTICFDCINEALNPRNLEHANFFCRTYNLPFNPDLWINLADHNTSSPSNIWKEYAATVLDDPQYKQNLYYSSTTPDLWSKVTKEWEKCRSFAEILRKLSTIRDSYLERGRLKWGEQYTFEDLIRLDSIYTKTIKANNITNSMQKEAIRTLCKLQIEIDEAIRAKDAKAIKDFSSSYAAFAKQADLENMINETKTDDITTVAELYDYMEKSGFQFRFYDGFDRDEVDRTIKDIQDANRRLILESTGLQATLEDMIKQKKAAIEDAKAAEVAEQQSLRELLDFKPEDEDIAVEDDTAALELNFEDGAE